MLSFNVKKYISAGRLAFYFVIMLVSVTSLMAQAENEWTIKPLGGHLYELSVEVGFTIKVLASVGPDGILLVDAGTEELAPGLKNALQSLGDSIPDIIISSHSHIEHTSGNKAFGRSPLIIGNQNVGPRLTSGSFLFNEFPPEALPELTFADSISLRFNDELIKIHTFAGAHDNSDIIVWFTDSKVVFVGAISNGHHFPSVDGKTGDVFKYIPTVKRLIDFLPEDVMIVPGHGADCNKDDLRNFYAMLVNCEKIIMDSIRAGKDYQTMVDEDILADYASFDGPYSNRGTWIKNYVDAVERQNNPSQNKKDVMELMYYTIRDKGGEAGLKLFQKLQKENADEYNVDATALLTVGYKLYNTGKFSDATPFINYYMSEYPDGDYVWYCHYALGNLAYDAGDKEKALEYYKKANELNPDDPEILNKIETVTEELK